MRKRQLLILFLLLVSVFIWSEDKISLRLWDQFASREWVKNTLAEYSVDHPNVQVSAELMSDEDREFLQKVIAAKMANTTPDIFNPNEYSLGFLVEEGMLSPPPPKYVNEIKKYYRPEAISLTTMKGVIWGYINDFNLTALLYYASLFKEVGLDPENPPKTWEQMRSYAKKLTKTDASGNMTQAGFAHQFGFDLGVVDQHLAMHAATGDKFFNDDYTKAFPNSPGGVRVTKFLADMSSDKSTNAGWINHFDIWPIRKAAMTIEDSWYPALITLPVGGLEAYKDVRSAFIPTETGKNFKSFKRCFSMVVSKDCPNKDQAWEFISWMHGAPKFRYLDYYAHEIGTVPPIKDFDTLVGWHDWKPTGLDRVNMKMLQTFMDSVPIAIPMPNIPDYEEIQDIVASEVENACFAKKTPQKAMDDAAAAINKVLEKRARKK